LLLSEESIYDNSERRWPFVTPRQKNSSVKMTGFKHLGKGKQDKESEQPVEME
jgi:hypothetical protein